MRDDEPVLGEVLRWSAEEGWGVLRSDHGRVFAHFSAIRDQEGFRSLEPGSRVWFHAERPGQDGYELRAVAVWTSRPASVTRTEPGGLAGTPDAHRPGPHLMSDPADGSPPPSP